MPPQEDTDRLQMGCLVKGEAREEGVHVGGGHASKSRGRRISGHEESRILALEADPRWRLILTMPTFAECMHPIGERGMPQLAWMCSTTYYSAAFIPTSTTATEDPVA